MDSSWYLPARQTQARDVGELARLSVAVGTEKYRSNVVAASRPNRLWTPRSDELLQVLQQRNQAKVLCQ